RQKQAELDRNHEAARLAFEHDERELALARRELAAAKLRGESDQRIDELKAKLEQLVARRQSEIEELDRQRAADDDQLRQSEARAHRYDAQLLEIERRRAVRKTQKAQSDSDEEQAALDAADQEDLEQYAELKRLVEEERTVQSHIHGAKNPPA